MIEESVNPTAAMRLNYSKRSGKVADPPVAETDFSFDPDYRQLETVTLQRQ